MLPLCVMNNTVANRTLKIPTIARVILDVLANKRYSDTVNMNARDEPNKTNEMVLAIT